MPNDKQSYQDSSLLALRSMLYALRWIEFGILIVVVLLYGWATYQRNLVWKDDLLLCLDVVKKSPNKARSYNGVGMYFYRKQLFDEAMPYFQKSLSINPDSDSAHNNLGLCFLGKDLVDQAIEELKQAINIKPYDGMYHINLGIAYWQKGLNDMAYTEIQIGKDLRRRHKNTINPY